MVASELCVYVMLVVAMYVNPSNFCCTDGQPGIIHHRVGGIHRRELLIEVAGIVCGFLHNNKKKSGKSFKKKKKKKKKKK